LNLKAIGVIAAKNRNNMIPAASKSLQKVRMGSTPATSPRVTSREYGEYGLYASRNGLCPCADKILLPAEKIKYISKVFVHIFSSSFYSINILNWYKIFAWFA
jgi:hypothetical protein